MPAQKRPTSAQFLRAETICQKAISSQDGIEFHFPEKKSAHNFRMSLYMARKAARSRGYEQGPVFAVEIEMREENDKWKVSVRRAGTRFDDLVMIDTATGAEETLSSAAPITAGQMELFKTPDEKEEEEVQALFAAQMEAYTMIPNDFEDPIMMEGLARQVLNGLRSSKTYQEWLQQEGTVFDEEGEKALRETLARVRAEG